MDPLTFLQTLVDLRLCYGIKSPDMELYDFGFSNVSDTIDFQETCKLCTYFLHVICRFKVIWRKAHRVDIYDEDTPCEDFRSEVKALVGKKVRRVTLSDKNDLWLDFGDYWMVFATFTNGEESWRLFASDVSFPHLVASDTLLCFSG